MSKTAMVSRKKGMDLDLDSRKTFALGWDWDLRCTDLHITDATQADQRSAHLFFKASPESRPTLQNVNSEIYISSVG